MGSDRRRAEGRADQPRGVLKVHIWFYQNRKTTLIHLLIVIQSMSHHISVTWCFLLLVPLSLFEHGKGDHFTSFRTKWAELQVWEQPNSTSVGPRNGRSYLRKPQFAAWKVEGEIPYCSFHSQPFSHLENVQCITVRLHAYRLHVYHRQKCRLPKKEFVTLHDKLTPQMHWAWQIDYI